MLHTIPPRPGAHRSRAHRGRGEDTRADRNNQPIQRFRYRLSSSWERGRDGERVCERVMERKRERLTNLSIPSDAWPQIQSGQRGGWCHHEYRTSVYYAMFDTFGSHALGYNMSEIMSYFTLVETGTSGLGPPRSLEVPLGDFPHIKEG